MSSRRTFLALAGGGVVLSAGGLGFWATTRDPVAARRPWAEAGGAESAPRRRALSHAILAPNPHNRQPWLVDLSRPDTVTLLCQADRRLPHTDPFDRQITIGLGCFVELFVQAAAADGYATDVVLFPEGEPAPRLDDRPVATLMLRRDPGMAPDPLFAHVLARRTNRNPYDTSRPVPDGTLRSIVAAAARTATGFTGDPVRVAALRRRAWAAMELELYTHATAKESVDLIRIGRAEIEANPDGISLAGPMMEALETVGFLDRAAMLDTGSATFRAQIDAVRVAYDTAMAFVWIRTPGNSRAHQVAAGRDYVRLNLAATAAGVAMQPFSQALQEFPEMAQQFAGMRAALDVGDGETLQMFARLGYGAPVKGAPRWPAGSRIRTA
jgi:hypothetical protein